MDFNKKDYKLLKEELNNDNYKNKNIQTEEILIFNRNNNIDNIDGNNIINDKGKINSNSNNNNNNPQNNNFLNKNCYNFISPKFSSNSKGKEIKDNFLKCEDITLTSIKNLHESMVKEN